MSGNVGTQSLAVTIRVLMDEELEFKQKIGFIFKEIRVGLCNGLIVGGISVVFTGLESGKITNKIVKNRNKKVLQYGPVFYISQPRQTAPLQYFQS